MAVAETMEDIALLGVWIVGVPPDACVVPIDVG
jgi:hypothetical protein